MGNSGEWISTAVPRRCWRLRPNHAAVHGASGIIIFDDGDGLLHTVSPSGGASTLVPGTAPGQRRLFPHALPDGRHYLFTSRNVNDLGQGIYVASLDSPDVRRVSDAWSKAVYATGHLIFGRQGALFAQPFDSVRLAVTGEPRHLADGLGIGCCTPLSFQFSASVRVLSFWSGSDISPAQLTWLDRGGKRLEIVGEPGNTTGVALAPDGRRVVLERIDPKTTSFDLWLLDLASGNRAARLTVDGNATSPVWSSDGTRLLVMYRARGLVAMPWRGGGLDTLVANPKSMWPSDWSGDGRWVAFLDVTGGSYRLAIAPAAGNEKPTVYREGPFELGMMRFFPGGGWVAYISEESGQMEVYVDSFPTPGEKTRVSTNGGAWPVWRQDGKELYLPGARPLTDGRRCARGGRGARSIAPGTSVRSTSRQPRSRQGAIRVECGRLQVPFQRPCRQQDAGGPDRHRQLARPARRRPIAPLRESSRSCACPGGPLIHRWILRRGMTEMLRAELRCVIRGPFEKRSWRSARELREAGAHKRRLAECCSPRVEQHADEHR